MADNHNVDVGLFLSHPGSLESRPESSKACDKQQLEIRWLLQVLGTKTEARSQPPTWEAAGAMAAGGKGGTEEPVRGALRMSTTLLPPLREICLHNYSQLLPACPSASPITSKASPEWPSVELAGQALSSKPRLVKESAHFHTLLKPPKMI